MSTKTKKRKTNKGIVLIKKANNLIESRYKFDIWETRIFLSILAQIRRDDTEFHAYRIQYRDVIKTFGLKSGDSYNLLRKGAKNLMAKSFFVNYEENGTVREKQYHILRNIDYLKEGQEGKAFRDNEYIDVVVEQEMKPFLLELQKNFTAYDLRNVVKLGVYPVRMYELLKQYEKIGKRTLEVEEMKRMFEVVDQYKLFADFFRWVVKPAVKEINKFTDLNITKLEKIKTGRRVVALYFEFEKKTSNQIRKARGESIQKQLDFGSSKGEEQESPAGVEETEKDKLFKSFFDTVVGKFGVTPSAFLSLLEIHNEEQVTQAIAVTNRAKYLQQIKSSVAGFFVHALKNGYTNEKEEAKKRERKEKEEKTIQDEKMNEILVERDKRLNERIKQVTTEQPEITERAIELLKKTDVLKITIQKKEKQFGRELELEDYRQDRILRKLVKTKIMELASEKFIDIINEFKEKIQGLV